MAIYDSKSYLYNTAQKRFYQDTANIASFKNSDGDNIVVPPECENRPDLLSYQVYGTSRLWWVIAAANADLLRDPVWDLRSGMTLFIPNRKSLKEQQIEIK
jgi:hypothetical protein